MSAEPSPQPSTRPDRWRERERHAPPATADQGRGAVLLVEDEPGVRELARRVLEKAGYRVIEARSGSEALTRLDELDAPLRLLLTDLAMPGMDGRELAGRVRERVADCPVVLMSGFTEGAVLRGRRLDGAAFLEKPFSPGELLRTVAARVAGD